MSEPATPEVKAARQNLWGLLDLLNDMDSHWRLFKKPDLANFYNRFVERWDHLSLRKVRDLWMCPYMIPEESFADVPELMSSEFIAWCQAERGRRKVDRAIGEAEERWPNEKEAKIRDLAFSINVWKVAEKMAEHVLVFNTLPIQRNQEFVQEVAAHTNPRLAGIFSNMIGVAYISSIANYMAREIKDPDMQTLMSKEFQEWLNDKIQRLKVEAALGESAKDIVERLLAEAPEFVPGSEPRKKRKSLGTKYVYDVYPQAHNYDGLSFRAKAILALPSGHSKTVKTELWVNEVPKDEYRNLINNYASQTGELEKIRKYGTSYIPMTRAHRLAVRWLFSRYPDKVDELKTRIQKKAEAWVKNHSNKKVYMGRRYGPSSKVPEPRHFKYDIRQALEPFRYVVTHADDYVSHNASHYNMTTFLRSQMKPGDEVIELTMGDWGDNPVPRMEFVVLVNAEEKPKLEAALQQAARAHVGNVLSDE